MKNIKCYITHYTPLADRKVFQKTQMSEHGFSYTFIEDFDRENLTETSTSKFCLNAVSMPCVSLFLKHIEAMRLISRSDHECGYILEDDAVFSEKFPILFPQILSELPRDYDMLFTGTSLEKWNLHIPDHMQNAGQLVYKKCRGATKWGGNGATRGTDSILVSKSCCAKILDYYDKLNKNNIRLPIDWWLNQTIRKLNLNVYWCEPTIVIQGSETIFGSSIGTN